MGQAAHHYLIFETRGGFCGIVWNNVGITRFQLPAKSAEGAQRMLLRRALGAKPGAPTPEVAEAVAAVKRYFEGKETDFSRFLCRGAAGRMGPHDHLWRSGKGTRRRTGSCARCRPGHGQQSGRADHPLPQGLSGRRQGWWFLRARRLDEQDPHARAGGGSRRASVSGAAIFRVLGRQCRRESCR
jgi:hypothetical protein